jgi:hypothetical protein
MVYKLRQDAVSGATSASDGEIRTERMGLITIARDEAQLDERLEQRSDIGHLSRVRELEGLGVMWCAGLKLASSSDRWMIFRVSCAIMLPHISHPMRLWWT